VSGNGRHAVYELPVAFFLEGPRSDLFVTGDETNRAIHIVDGRLRAPFSELPQAASISLWCWNGMPTDAREVTGWMVSYAQPYGAGGLSLGVGGTATAPGRLVLRRGEQTQPGTTQLDRWSWNHIVLVRDGNRCRVYLNGNPEPEVTLSIDSEEATGGQLTFGGCGDRASNWEGRLDEIAVFDRALSDEEIQRLWGGVK